MNKILVPFLAWLAAAGDACAHAGHGMPGATHWHASDVAGLALVAIGALFAVWLSRKR